MTVQEWDADQAVTRGPLDEDLEGCFSIDRFGVAADDELMGEPLEVALGQEEPEVVDFDVADDQWVFVDGDDCDAPLFDDVEHAPEELAMHVVVP